MGAGRSRIWQWGRSSWSMKQESGSKKQAGSRILVAKCTQESGSRKQTGSRSLNRSKCEAGV